MKPSFRKSRSAFSRARQSQIEHLEQRCLMSATPSGFTPVQIAAAYGISAIKFGSIVGDGSGQTIAIVNAYDNPKLVSTGNANFNTSDLHLFDQQFGLADPPSFIKVNQSGGTSYPAQSPPGTDTTTSWAGEADLDVEWAHAMAPKANIVLVEANSGSILDLIGDPLNNTSGGVDYARHRAGVSVISMSFGVSEFNDGSAQGSETSYDQYFTTPAGHNGITFFAASGDNGQPGLYPAFSPNVVSVGDTSLTLNGSTYSSESGFSKSGGGVSQFEAKPSYQSSLSGSKRMSPDVAFDGDPNTSVPVYDSFDAQGPWIKLGGTSFSTPVWAALMAITNQGRKLQSSSNDTLNGINETLPKLYSLSSADFHDVSPSGYDIVTGRGTPIANKLVVDLSGFVATSTTGSIAGLIFSDANGNGTQDNGELGISGRTVYNDTNNNGADDSGELSTVTDGSGNYVFSGLSAGSYKIRQVLPSGSKQTSPSGGFGWTISLSNGQSQTAKNFGSQDSGVVVTGGSISGLVFSDANSDGAQNNGDLGIAGRTVYNDANNNGLMDNGEVFVTTDANGNYAFSNLSAGNYKIRQVLPSGSKQTSPSGGLGWTISLSSNQSQAGKNFGSHDGAVVGTGGSISGSIFNDANGNGVNNSEAALTGWTVYNDANNNGKMDSGELNTTTNGSGNYSLTGLAAGNYKIRIVLMTGFKQTTPSNGFGYTLSLSSNQAVGGKVFGAQSTGGNNPPPTGASISGNVFNDANNDAKLDNGEAGLSGWTVFLDLNNSGVLTGSDPKATTDASGNYTLSGLSAGTFIVRVVRPSGWTQTSPANGFGQHVTVSTNQAKTGIIFGEHS